MANIILESGQSGCFLLSVPADIAEHAHEYQMAFDRWLMDPANDHGYWQYLPDDDEPVLCYHPPEAFAKWLNETVLLDRPEKAEVFPEEIPLLHF